MRIKGWYCSSYPTPTGSKEVHFTKCESVSLGWTRLGFVLMCGWSTRRRDVAWQRRRRTNITGLWPKWCLILSHVGETLTDNQHPLDGQPNTHIIYSQRPSEHPTSVDPKLLLKRSMAPTFSPPSLFCDFRISLASVSPRRPQACLLFS